MGHMSSSQFSVSFYAKFFSCVICSLFIVGASFFVMNSWLGVSSNAPLFEHLPPLSNNSLLYLILRTSACLPARCGVRPPPGVLLFFAFR